MNEGLVAFLQALPELDRGELLGLSAAYAAGSVQDREAARAAVRATVDRAACGPALAGVEREILHWAETQGARSGAYTFASPAGDLLLADLRKQALPALLDAAAVIALGDALDAASGRVLMAPWHLLRGRGDSQLPRPLPVGIPKPPGADRTREE